jgi:hypothetical protein
VSVPVAAIPEGVALRLSLLVPDLVPSGAYGLAGRSVFAHWDALRALVARLARNRCAACAQVFAVLHLHESYDFTGPRPVVTRVAPLCMRCHEVVHFGLAMIRGHGGRALDRMARVNGWDRERCRGAVREAFTIWRSFQGRTYGAPDASLLMAIWMELKQGEGRS